MAKATTLKKPNSSNANGNNGGKAKGDIRWQFARTFGQEINLTTWRLARMNLAICSMKGILALEPAYSFHRDLPDAELPLAA